MENGIGVGPSEELKRLGGSQGTIQLALDALGEKKGSVDQASTSSEGTLSDMIPGRCK